MHYNKPAITFEVLTTYTLAISAKHKTGSGKSKVQIQTG